jgi:hypothetical protein
VVDLLAHLVVIGIATALEPVQLVTFIAILSSSQGVRAGWAFLAGWIASLSIVGLVTWLAAARLSDFTADVLERRGVRRGFVIAELVVGVGLLAYSLWRVLRAPREPHESRLSVRGSTLTASHAAFVGLLIPPWPLVIAGALDVLRAEVGVARSLTALLVFVAAATSLLFGMQIWATESPESSMRHLARARAWLEPHTEHLITGIAVLVGLWLVVRSIRRW